MAAYLYDILGSVLNRKRSPREPETTVTRSPQRTVLELHDVASPDNLHNNVPEARQNANEDQVKPMSTAVVLQRYWKLSASCQLVKDNELDFYFLIFFVSISLSINNFYLINDAVRYACIVRNVSALDHLCHHTVFSMGNNRLS